MALSSEALPRGVISIKDESLASTCFSKTWRKKERHLEVHVESAIDSGSGTGEELGGGFSEPCFELFEGIAVHGLGGTGDAAAFVLGTTDDLNRSRFRGISGQRRGGGTWIDDESDKKAILSLGLLRSSGGASVRDSRRKQNAKIEHMILNATE